MQHLRTLAGALALALCLAACSPKGGADQCWQPSDTTSGGEESGERFGAMPSQAFYLDQATTGDITTPAVSDTGLRVLCFSVVIVSTGDPIGVLELEGSLDGTNYVDVYLDENKVYGNGTFSGGTQITINDPAATLTVSFCVENPMPYMRVFYDRTSGGAAAGADFYTHALRN